MSRPIIIGAGSPNDHSSIQLSTKKGNHIPNERRKERSPESLKAAEEIWKKKFPHIRTRSLSATYNCVGLVFGCRRTCIDPENLTKILQEDGYKKLPDNSHFLPGDLVIYVNNQQYSHIGVIVHVEPNFHDGTYVVTILSQWGADGEYLHLLEHVPDDYGTPEFWSERKHIS
jgi:hypothetical protein